MAEISSVYTVPSLGLLSPEIQLRWAALLCHLYAEHRQSRMRSRSTPELPREQSWTLLPRPISIDPAKAFPGSPPLLHARSVSHGKASYKRSIEHFTHLNYFIESCHFALFADSLLLPPFISIYDVQIQSVSIVCHIYLAIAKETRKCSLRLCSEPNLAIQRLTRVANISVASKPLSHIIQLSARCSLVSFYTF